MSIETLSNPGDLVFRDVESYFGRMEEDGYRPPQNPKAWKCLGPMPRQEVWARAMTGDGPIRQFFSVSVTEIHIPLLD
jgi:hypothetical protein